MIISVTQNRQTAHRKTGPTFATRCCTFRLSRCFLQSSEVPMKKIRIRRKVKKLTRKRGAMRKWGTRAALGAAAAGIAAAGVMAARKRGAKKRAAKKGASTAKKGRATSKKRSTRG